MRACPTCSAPFEFSTPVAGRRKQPGAGDFTVCANCTALLRYDAQLTPRLATEQDLAALTPFERLGVEMVRSALRHSPRVRA